MIVPLSAIGGAFLSLLMGVLPAQLPVLEASPEDRQLVAVYRQVVERYRRGEADSVDAVTALPRNHLDSILKLILGLPHMPWARPEELRGAAMLHTDAALRIVGPDDEDGPRRRHLTVAGRLLHASSAAEDPFVTRWYVAVSRVLRERHLFAVAQDLLQQGRARVPGNPAILYESATLAELLARGYSVTVTENASGVPSIDADAARNQQRRAGFLNDAARWLREALARQRAQDARPGSHLEGDNTLLMARLHLGRVETLRDNEKDGLAHLEQIFTATGDADTAYLAALFSGAAHERLRRPDAAEASYRRAIERNPAGQAAYIALSEVLQRTGRPVESRAVLHTLLETKGASVGEPLWWYLVDPPGVPDERLGGLRREVRP